MAWHKKAVLDKEIFIESIKLWLAGDIKKKEAVSMCDVTDPTWTKYVKIFCEKGDLPAECWKEKKLTASELKEKEFWDSIGEDVTEREEEPKKEKKEVWHLSSFKNM